MIFFVWNRTDRWVPACSSYTLVISLIFFIDFVEFLRERWSLNSSRGRQRAADSGCSYWWCFIWEYIIEMTQFKNIFVFTWNYHMKKPDLLLWTWHFERLCLNPERVTERLRRWFNMKAVFFIQIKHSFGSSSTFSAADWTDCDWADMNALWLVFTVQRIHRTHSGDEFSRSSGSHKLLHTCRLLHQLSLELSFAFFTPQSYET